MTRYQLDLMALIKRDRPDLDGAELEAATLALYNTIQTALEESRDRMSKKQ